MKAYLPCAVSPPLRLTEFNVIITRALPLERMQDAGVHVPGRPGEGPDEAVAEVLAECAERCRCRWVLRGVRRRVSLSPGVSGVEGASPVVVVVGG